VSNQLLDVGDAYAEICIGAVVQKAEANAGYAFEASFHGGGEGARVDDVDGGIRAVVDARDAEIRRPAIKENRLGDLDAVYRSTAAFVSFYLFAKSVAFADEDRTLYGNGVALGGLRAVRSYYKNVPKFPGGVHEGFQAAGRDAVVVGDQDERHGA
jgi:hypothetical protein